MICRSYSLVLRSCILLATILLLIAVIAPLCTAADLNSNTFQPPAASVPPATVYAGESAGDSPGTDASGYCTQPGAIGIKVTINPLSTVPLPTTTSPARGINIPATTPAPAVTIRFNHTLVTVPPVTTTTAPVTTLTIQPVTPSLAINRSPAVAAVTTTPCRACNVTTVTTVTRNLSKAGLAPSVSVLRPSSPQKGIVESVVDFLGSLIGVSRANPYSKYTRWDRMHSDLLQIASPSVTYKTAGSRFIEMESYDSWNIYGTGMKGTYTWAPGVLAQNNFTSVKWQASLNPFPSDLKYWSNPPGLLGSGDADLVTREFTVDYSVFLPPVEEVDTHWAEKTPILLFRKSELEQIEAQLAVQAPFDPGVGQSPADQFVNEQLEAARVEVQQKLNDPDLQGYHAIYQHGSMALRSLPPPGSSQSSQSVNYSDLSFRPSVMKEALVLTLPSDRRTVYIRVVTFDANGNATGLSNSLPVVVGKKEINLISPWSDWQVISPAGGQQPGGGVMGISAVYFNKKTYLFGTGSADHKLLMATLDENNIFSGWNELPGAPGSTKPVSAASVMSVESDDPMFLYLALLPNDGSHTVKYNRMDRQGAWSGWKAVPGGVLTEDTPILTSWVRNEDKGLVLTVREMNTNRNKFTGIMWVVRGTPAFADETWDAWQEIPAGPVASIPPTGVRFTFDRPETPLQTPDFKRGYVFIGRSQADSGPFKGGHLYSITYNQSANGNNPSWSWTEWKEIPGNAATVSPPSVLTWNDRIYVSITGNTKIVSIADFDALGEWNNWSSHPSAYPDVGSPILSGGDTLRLITPGAGGVGRDKLIISTLSGAQFLVSKGPTAPLSWIYCSSGDVEQPDCTRYYSTGGVFIPHPEGMTGSWAGNLQGGKKVIWQVSRIPFNTTAGTNISVTFNDLMIRTPGVDASGIRDVDPEHQIAGKPAYIPAVHSFSMNPVKFSPNPNERLTFYARAVILTTTDIPGTLNGYVTPPTKFIYGALPMPKVCPMPEEHKVVVPVPDVKIIEYQPYYAGEPGCHAISTKGVSMEVMGDEVSPCPTAGTTMYLCDEPSWWDEVCDFFSSIVDFFASMVNFVSRAWDTIKSTCIDIVASAVPFCDDYCKMAMSGAVDVGLASIGVPPHIPNFAELQDMGADYLAAKMAEEAGIPKEAAREAMDAINEAARNPNTEGDVCGWKPDPAYEPRPAYIKVRLRNNHNQNSTPGNLVVKTPIVGPGSEEYRKRNLYETSTEQIPYPSMQHGEELIIPIFLTPSVSANDGSDGGVPPDIWNVAASSPYLRLEVHEKPERSVDIAALEKELGMEYVDMTNYHPRLSYGECPQKEFYVTYVYFGTVWDKVQGFRPGQAYTFP